MSQTGFTLLYAGVSIAVFLSCLVITVYRRHKPLRVFAYAFACSTISSLLLAMQTLDNIAVSIIWGNLFFLLSYILIYFGTQIFYENESRWPLRFGIYLGVGAVAIVWFTLFDYSVLWRSLAFALLSTILFVDFVLHFRRYFHAMQPTIRTALLATLIFTELSFIGRIIIALFTTQPASLAAQATALNTYIMFSYVIYSIFWLTTLILLDNDRLLAELQKQNLILEPLAHTDKLTGLHNRNKLYETISEYVEMANRLPRPLTFIIADLDNFKNVNDTFGHAVGDATLRRLAEILRNNVRSTDQVFRWGGEEFLILAVGTNAAGGAKLAESLRAKIEAETFDVIGQMTVSFGVAEQLPGERFDKWFRRADYALYQAKNAGRNQVQICHEEELPDNVIMNGNLEALPSDGFALNPDHPSRS